MEYKVSKKVLATIRWRIGLYIEEINKLQNLIANTPDTDVFYKVIFQQISTLCGVIYNLKQDFYPHLEDIIVPKN